MLPIKDIEIILSFGQYLHWSQMQYEHYRSYKEDSSDADFFGALAHWLASLYVVAEGWQEIGIPDRVIAELIAKYDEHLQLMRRLRNGVYHFQRKPLSEKLTDFLDPKSEGTLWAEALLFEYKRFLVCAMPDDIKGDEIGRAIGWWPGDFLVWVKALRGDKYGEINPALRFLTRVSDSI